MRIRILLAAFLLGVGLCFVPGAGHGEVPEWMVNYGTKAGYMDVKLLEARVNYIMNNPTNFLSVVIYYDPIGMHADRFPEGVDTAGKVCVDIYDIRDRYSHTTGIALLNQFKRTLEIIYSYIQYLATDMDVDVVAMLMTREEIPLGYFYQGEYHLWER